MSSTNGRSNGRKKVEDVAARIRTAGQNPSERTTEQFVKEAARFVLGRSNLFVEYLAAEREDWLDRHHIDGCFRTKNSLMIPLQIKTGEAWIVDHYQAHPDIFAFSPKGAMVRGVTPEEYSHTLERIAYALLKNSNERAPLTPFELYLKLDLSPTTSFQATFAFSEELPQNPAASC